MWLAEDREYLAGWLIEQALTCPICGTRDEEWDPEQGGNLNAYYAETYLCHGCERREIEAQEWRDDMSTTSFGKKVRLIRGENS